MTKKLYYEDSFLKNFTASIVTVNEKDGEYHVELDQTAFYPEGGGQPADKGTIGKFKVNNVYKEEGRIFHILDRLPEEQKNLECRVDWKRRFDHMQQHTGQHILSAVFKRLFDANTIGFHLGDDYVSIDLDRELSCKKVSRVETEANQVIYDNFKIDILYPDKEELERMKLRKEPVVEEDIRVVKIGELDCSPCGGTHLESTGQLGLIKIIDVSGYKGGLRVKFLCGKRALEDYEAKNNIIAAARKELSVQEEQIISEVQRLKEEVKAKGNNIAELKEQLLTTETEKLLTSSEKIGTVRLIKMIYDDIPINDVRNMALKLSHQDKTVVIMGQRDNTSARLILGCSQDIKELNMNEIIKKPLGIINGNGGGSPQMAQGGGNDLDKLEEAVDRASAMVKELLA